MERGAVLKFERPAVDTERTSDRTDHQNFHQAVREGLRPRTHDHHGATRLLNERAALLKQQEAFESDRDFEAQHEHQLTLQDAEQARAQHEIARARHDDLAATKGAFTKMLSSQFGEMAQLKMRMDAHRGTYEKHIAHAKTLERATQLAARKREALQTINARIAAIDAELEKQRSAGRKAE